MILSEQELLRRQKREDLMKLGIDPYPAEMFDVNVTAEDILKNYENNKLDYKSISIAGRLMSFRIMGSASFAELQDSTGRIQVYFRRDDLCPGEDKTLYNTVFKKLLDIGDIIGVKGFVFTTQTGEISIHVTEFKILNKSLKPLPVVKRDDDGNIYDGFTDPEMRYRQRYVDLIVNPEVKDIFIKRARIVTTMRTMFDSKGWLEVETPILQSIHGGASARPFKTHHNTLDMPLFMRIANELYLKRLIVGGFDGVYEFGKMFRNEGMDRTHNPEFTSLEFYVAYKDYNWMMTFTEEIFEKVALATNGKTKIKVGENEIEFGGEFTKLSIAGAIEKYTGVNVEGMDEETLRGHCKLWGIEVDATMGTGKLIDEIFGEAVERHNQMVQDSMNKYKPLITKKIKVKKPQIDRTIQYAETAQKVRNKTEMAKEVFNDYLFTKRSIYDRVNYQVLDSLLKYEVKMKGIEIPFEYGISSLENPSYLHYASSMKYKVSGLKSDKDTYSVNLFPNDYSNSESYLRVYFPNQDRYIIRNIWMMYATSLLLILVVLGCFYVAVSTIVKQKQLADIKNDFINNMTHEFKTPISTISLATQMLGDEAVTASPSMFKRYLGIIRDENKRLGSQVEKVLQTAQMERGEVRLNLGTVNVHQIIERVLGNISPQIELREGIIDIDLQAENPEIQADEVHLTNIIFNLLDNANKYSPEKPIIKITTENTEKGLSIKVSDQGIGMTKESIKQIFEKFYRVPTGNVHDVKGFGLGLSYVKKMVEEHNGRINVVSKLGEGSEFEVVVPGT